MSKSFLNILTQDIFNPVNLQISVDWDHQDHHAYYNYGSRLPTETVSFLEGNKYSVGGRFPYFLFLISKIPEDLKWSCEDAGKTTAENLQPEHSVKPKEEIISKALESWGVFFFFFLRWKMKGKPAQVAYQETDGLLKKWTKRVPSTSTLLNCSILSTFMQIISLAKRRAE